MGKVYIQSETTKNPISLIGKEAGVCWGADVENPEKNYKRGLNCLKSGHGRTFEFAEVYMVLDGYSARVIREFYTHIGGAPTRLQESTRYIDFHDGFKYVIPHSIEENEVAKEIYTKTMDSISNGVKELEDIGIHREDSAMLLPLGMETKIVVRMNFRTLFDMSHQRLCNRAYWEFREMFLDIKNSLAEYSEEWKYLSDNYLVPKCKYFGKCTEAHPCGKPVKY